MKIRLPKISTWTHQISRKRILFVISLLSLALIPLFLLWSHPPGEGENHEKIFWLIDASLSMKAEEKVGNHTTSRMTIVKDSLLRIFASGASGEHGIGLFAQDMRIVSPFTRDRTFLTNAVRNIPFITYNGGTNILGSVDDTLHLLMGENIHLIIITDGGDERGYCRSASCPWSVMKGKTRITLIGVGSIAGGKIPVGQNLAGDATYRSYAGKTVISKRNDENLRQIASILGAELIRIDPTASDDWERIVLPVSSFSWGMEMFLTGMLLLFLLTALFFPIFTPVQRDSAQS